MKILIADTVFPIGHKNLNNRLLQYLDGCDLTIMNNKCYYDESHYPKCRFVNFNSRGETSTSKRDRIQEIKLFRELAKQLKPDHFDKIVFFTFDTLNFALEHPFLNSKDIFLFHHKNTSELKLKHYRWLFKTYSNKVHHIVFSKSIAQYLVDEMGVKKELVHELPHPILLPLNAYNETANDLSSPKRWIGLGYGNDESLIERIIEFEKAHKILYQNNIQLILRWSRPEYNSESIRIINGHLSKDEYTRLYEESSGVLLLYPLSYVNRFSGAIMDGMACNKQIIGTDIPVVREFANEYKSYCSYFKDIRELFGLLVYHGSNPTISNTEDFERFKKTHSDNTVKSCFFKILNED